MRNTLSTQSFRPEEPNYNELVKNLMAETDEEATGKRPVGRPRQKDTYSKLMTSEPVKKLQKAKLEGKELYITDRVEEF